MSSSVLVLVAAANWNTHEAIIYTSMNIGLLLSFEEMQLKTFVFHSLIFSFVKNSGGGGDALSSELQDLDEDGAAAAVATGSVGFPALAFFRTSARDVGFFSATVSTTFCGGGDDDDEDDDDGIGGGDRDWSAGGGGGGGDDSGGKCDWSAGGGGVGDCSFAVGCECFSSNSILC